MRRVLRVDAQPVLVGVVLRLLDDRRRVGLRLGSHTLSLLACGFEQALGLRRGVADQQARLLLCHPQHGLELLAVVGNTLFDGGARKLRGERRHLRLGLAQLGGRRGEVGFELSVRLLLLRTQLVEGPGVVRDELLDLGLLLRTHLVERVATRLLGGGELVLIALHARRQLPDGVVDLAAFVPAEGDGERVAALTRAAALLVLRRQKLVECIVSDVVGHAEPSSEGGGCRPASRPLHPASSTRDSPGEIPMRSRRATARANPTRPR